MLLQTLEKEKLIHPPPFLPLSTHYMTMMGSQAYGTSHEASDIDIYGFCVPNKDTVFPHTAGVIHGFGRQKKEFNQWQEQHIKHNKSEYDFCIYNIVRYFHLVMEGNPNLVESLFVPLNCILHITKLGQHVRENRKLFLHQGFYIKCKAYAYSQLHKMGTAKENTSGKRKELRDRFGLDTKFASHTVRLLYEAEMALLECDLDLQRNREHLKAIRRGEVPEEDIRLWAAEKEKYLEKAKETSKLPLWPDEEKIKTLLLECLEMHFGKLDNIIHVPNKAEAAMEEISRVVDKYRLTKGA